MIDDLRRSSDPLDAVISGMGRFEPSEKYYALTLSADRRGGLVWTAYSHLVGWSERNPRWEMRAASLVNPERMSVLWDRLGESWVTVHDDLQLAVFLRLGGNMLVEKAFADQRLPDEVSPKECVPDATLAHGGGGFLVTEDLPDEAVERRVPSRKLRGQVLRRDDYRCVMCGRRPRDHLDLELHVHHVIPWRMSGPTAEENLVTLCGTCHKGPLAHVDQHVDAIWMDVLIPAVADSAQVGAGEHRPSGRVQHVPGVVAVVPVPHRVRPE